MTNSSRELGGTVVRGLAKVGLVWAVAVLAVVFMAMSAQSQYGDGTAVGAADASAPSRPSTPALDRSSDGQPRAAGVALAVLFFGIGGSVLVVGALRDGRERRRYELQTNPAEQLPMAFGLSQLG